MASVIAGDDAEGTTPTSPEQLQITGTRLAGPHSTSVVLDVFQNRSGAAHPNTW